MFDQAKKENGAKDEEDVDEFRMLAPDKFRQRSTLGRGTIKKLNTKGEIIELGESQLVSEEDIFIQKIV